MKKLSIVLFCPFCCPDIGLTNVQTASLANPRATLLFSLPKYSFVLIMYFVLQSQVIQILIPLLLGFLSMCRQKAHFTQKGSNCLLMQTTAPTKYIEFQVSTNISWISRKAASLLSNHRSVFVASLTNLIIGNRN